MPGCGGCGKSGQKTQAEKEKEEAEKQAKEEEERRKKKPPVETRRLVSQPRGATFTECRYKPGHWTAAALRAKANHAHLLGDLATTVLDARGEPVRLVGMPYTSTGSREVVLPKGQWKRLESVFYVPAQRIGARVSGQIRIRKGGRGPFPWNSPLSRMPSYQYHFAVFARYPLGYKYLDSLDSVRHPNDLQSSRGFYQISLFAGDKGPSLPRHGLLWTSIAYLLWDDAEPTALVPEQRAALLDWLHWGGRLIISGPDSLDSLDNSFLAPYLPAKRGGSKKLTEADFDELNDWWTT
ncbi:MAG: hypothetical protein ACYTG0_43045, partial [Planctomycetota bacterium]